jgi:hypothetical protein
MELVRCGRHEQLEEKATVPVVQPGAEPRQTLGLATVDRAVAVGVVADEDLGEGGFERLDIRSEIVAVLEIEFGLAGLLDRHSQHVITVYRPLGDAGPILLVHEDAGCVAGNTAPSCFHEALANDSFGVDDASPDLSVIGREALNRSRSKEPRWSKARR